MALGIIVGDIIYVLLVVNGLDRILSVPSSQKLMALFGGLILLFMGIKSVFGKSSSEVAKQKILGTSSLSFFMNGFIVNFINPFVITVWIGFLAICQSKFKESSLVNLALIIALAFILITDLLKAHYANKLRNFFSQIA